MVVFEFLVFLFLIRGEQFVRL